jgi:hypothetical protein
MLFQEYKVQLGRLERLEMLAYLVQLVSLEHQGQKAPLATLVLMDYKAQLVHGVIPAHLDQPVP